MFEIQNTHSWLENVKNINKIIIKCMGGNEVRSGDSCGPRIQGAVYHPIGLASLRKINIQRKKKMVQNTG